MGVIDQVAPGDVLVVRTKSPWGILVRIGAWLTGKPNTVDHVAVYHHRDLAGISWAVEGRPGGVGWVDVRQYDGPHVVSNAGQPKTGEQRKAICDLTESLLQRPYDWGAIAQDAIDALHVRDLWASTDYGDDPPGHVVCSSLAAWVYRHVGLDHPAGKDGRVRWVTPGDWARFVADRAWLPDGRG